MPPPQTIQPLQNFSQEEFQQNPALVIFQTCSTLQGNQERSHSSISGKMKVLTDRVEEHIKTSDEKDKKHDELLDEMEQNQKNCREEILGKITKIETVHEEDDKNKVKVEMSKGRKIAMGSLRVGEVTVVLGIATWLLEQAISFNIFGG